MPGAFFAATRRAGQGRAAACTRECRSLDGQVNRARSGDARGAFVIYAARMPTFDELARGSLASLEQAYREARLGPEPRGIFRGRALARVDGALAKSLRGAAFALPFERLPFGIDFDARAWWFVHPRLRIGHFRVVPGRSRWRDAETLRLVYDVSRLPGPIRGMLYDEVKPLGAGLCLGLGGIDAGPGEGDLFFFALEATGARAP